MLESLRSLTVHEVARGSRIYQGGMWTDSESLIYTSISNNFKERSFDGITERGLVLFGALLATAGILGLQDKKDSVTHSV